METDDSDDLLRAQRERLPAVWGRIDLGICEVTKFALFGAGLAFTIMITLEVISRYVFDFSIFFINAAARMLLVWFFLLGAGLALRQGAHVGFEVVRSRLPARLAAGVKLFGQVLVLIFLLQMLWGGLLVLQPSMRQMEASLGISLFWVMLAFPVSFGLLTYHLVTIMVVEHRTSAAEVR